MSPPEIFDHIERSGSTVVITDDMAVVAAAPACAPMAEHGGAMVIALPTNAYATTRTKRPA